MLLSNYFAIIDKESLAESRCLLFIVPLSLGCFQCHFAARGGSAVPFVRAVPRSCWSRLLSFGSGLMTLSPFSFLVRCFVLRTILIDNWLFG
jgi:hypothetical protein